MSSPHPDLAPALAGAPATLQPIDRLPGPRGWPLLGNVPQIDLPHLHRQLEHWASVFGPVYLVHLGRQAFVCLADCELIAAVLRQRPEVWRRVSRVEAIGREIGAHGVFSAEGDDWLRQRRMVMRAFDPAHLKSFFPRLLLITGRLRQRLREAADAGREIELQPQLMRYSVDVAAGLAPGGVADAPGAAFGTAMTAQEPGAPSASEIDAAVASSSGRIRWRIASSVVREACIPTFSAATTSLPAPRSGTAIERRPRSSSWSRMQ